jgi:hypothetical protein
MDCKGADNGLRRCRMCIEGCEIERQRHRSGQGEAQEIEDQRVFGMRERPGADRTPTDPHWNHKENVYLLCRPPDSGMNHNTLGHSCFT